MILTHLGDTLRFRVAEWLLGVILFSWGLILIRPEDTFALSTGYLGLARLATEYHWAWGCLIVGGLRLVALFINGWFVPPTYHIRSLTSFLSCLFWLSISLGMMQSGSATTGLAAYPWLFVADLYCLRRTAIEYRMALAVKAAS